MPETDKVISAIAPNNEFDKEPFWWIAANVPQLTEGGNFTNKLNTKIWISIYHKCFYEAGFTAFG
jgi:hypothetical protein